MILKLFGSSNKKLVNKNKIMSEANGPKGIINTK